VGRLVSVHLSASNSFFYVLLKSLLTHDSFTPNR